MADKMETKWLELSITNKGTNMDVRQCTIIILQHYSFSIGLKYFPKSWRETQKKKKKPKEDYYKSEGRIKTAVLRSFHFLYQEEIQGQIGVGSLISLLIFW